MYEGLDPRLSRDQYEIKLGLLDTGRAKQDGLETVRNRQDGICTT